MAVALENTKVSLDSDLKAEVASALALIEELSAKSSDSGLSEETCWELFGGPCPEALRKKIRNLEQDAPTKEDSEVFYSVTDMPQMEIIEEAKEEEEPGKQDAIEQRPTKKMSSEKRGSVEQKDILSERESPNTKKFTKERRSVDKDGLIDNEESGRKDVTNKDLALLEKYVCHCKERSEYLTDKDLAFLEKYTCRCKEKSEQNKTSNLLSPSNEKHDSKEFLEKISSKEEKSSRKSDVSKEINMPKEEPTGGSEKEIHENNFKDGKSSEKSVAISSKEEKPSRKSDVSKETNVSKEEPTDGLEKETHESNFKDGKSSEKSVAISSKKEKPSRKSDVSKETNVSKEEPTDGLEKETHESNFKDGKSSEKSGAISSKEEKPSRKSDVSKETNVSKEQPTGGSEKETRESNSKNGKPPKKSETPKETASLKEIGILKEQRLSKESKPLEEKSIERKSHESKDDNKSSKMESESPNTKIIDSNTSKGGAEEIIRVEKLDESMVKTNGSKSTANNASLGKHSTDSRQGKQSKDKSEFISIGTATSLQATASKSSNISRTKTKELLTRHKSIGSEKIMSTDKNQQTKIGKVKNMYTSVSTTSVPKEVKEKRTEARAPEKADSYTSSSESTIVSEVPKRKHRYSKSDSNNNSKCSCICCVERQIRKSYKKDVGSCRCCKKEAVRCQCCIQSSKSSGEKCQIKFFNEDEPFINKENFKKLLQITSFDDNRNAPAVCNKRMQTSKTRIFGDSGREFPDQYIPYSFNPLYMDPAYSRLIYSQKAPRPQPIRKPKTNQESHGYFNDFKPKSLSRESSENSDSDEYHGYPNECVCNGSESHEDSSKDDLLERSASEAFRKFERQNTSTSTYSESDNRNYRQPICRPRYPKYNDYKLPPVRPKTDICSCCSKPKPIIKRRPNVPLPQPCNCCKFKIKYT